MSTKLLAMMVCIHMYPYVFKKCQTSLSKHLQKIFTKSFESGEVPDSWKEGNISPFFKKEVLSGVPQGTVLGPLLFIIFINDLPEAITGLSKLFADDTKLVSIIRNQMDLTNLQNDINQLIE